MLQVVGLMDAMILRGSHVLAWQAQSIWPTRGMFQLRIPVATQLVGSVSLALGVNALSVTPTAQVKGTCQRTWLTKNLTLHIPWKM